MLVNGAEYRDGAICTSTPTILIVQDSPDLQLVIGVRGGLGGIAKPVLPILIHHRLLKCDFLTGRSQMLRPVGWSDERIRLIAPMNIAILRHGNGKLRSVPFPATYSSCITRVVFFLRVRSALRSRRSITKPP